MMKKKLANTSDVVLVYQERQTVEPAIQQIMELELEFKTFKFNPNILHEVTDLKPKVLLLSSNNVKKTVQLYISFLEEYENNIAPHSAILLINNRESSCAYLACENGLFDSYVIINPFNEPYRLKLVLLQELKIIESHKNTGLKQLISEGEDELASCIEHGVMLKKSFINQVSKCEDEIKNATNSIVEDSDTQTALQNLIDLSLKEMNEKVQIEIQSALDQLIELKLKHQSLKQSIDTLNSPKKKSMIGINKEAFDDNQSLKSSSYKILIAEPSDLYAQVIKEMFDETVFKYLFVKDGGDVLTQVEVFKPDVMLLAYDLDTIDGLEVTRTLRNEGNKVPIIAYTHHRDKSVIKRWVTLGLSAYLIKPSKRSLILKSVTNAIKDPVNILHTHNTAEKGDIHWLPEYSVGNKVLDEQHKELLKMTNEFFHQEGKSSAIALFQNLTSYIDLHFETEESLLRQINYPDTEEHINKHNKLRGKFSALQGKLAHYDEDLHHKIAMFLYNWLANHMLKEDMDYKSYALSIEEESFTTNI